MAPRSGDSKVHRTSGFLTFLWTRVRSGLPLLRKPSQFFPIKAHARPVAVIMRRPTNSRRFMDSPSAGRKCCFRLLRPWAGANRARFVMIGNRGAPVNAFADVIGGTDE